MTTNLTERPSRSIVCVESEIRQVLSNLVSNAIYAMQEHGGRLSVGSRETKERVNGGKWASCSQSQITAWV